MVVLGVFWIFLGLSVRFADTVGLFGFGWLVCIGC